MLHPRKRRKRRPTRPGELGYLRWDGTFGDVEIHSEILGEDDDIVHYIRMRDANPYHEPAGSSKGGQFARGPGSGDPRSFISPNVKQLNFVQAVEQLSSPRQRAVAEAAQDVDAVLGLHGTNTSVIGAWADGAENSVMVRQDGATWEQTRVSSAMKGWLANQKAVLAFKPDLDGEEFLVSFPMSGDLTNIHAALLQGNLPFHTLEPKSGGATVYVYGQDQASADAINAHLEKHDLIAETTLGTGEFIGTRKEDGSDAEQRADARRVYEEVIEDKILTAFPGRDAREDWNELRNRWASRLKETEGLGDAWSEEGHPRHPKGSERGGEFARKPGDGGATTNYGLIPADVAKFKELKSEWAKINNELLEYVDAPDGPEAKARIDKLESIVQEMQQLRADPGTPAGIGLPGGPRDVVIIGAGPGGLTASISGAAEGMDTLVIEANVVAGGQAKFSSRIENFPGFPVGVSGEHLTQNMYEQATRLGAEIKLGVRVTGMSFNQSTGLKELTLSNGEYIKSRTVILAGGVEFRSMQFPGSDGPGLIVGDGKELAKVGAGGKVCVIGGSNGAAQAALGCARVCEHVYLLSRSSIVNSMSDYQIVALHNNRKITVIEGDSIKRLNRDAKGNPEIMETANGRKLEIKALGQFLGSLPDTKWVPKDIVLAKGGRVQTNEDLEAAVPGVYAIGDMREGAIGRIGVAVGEGQLALRQVNAFLDAQRKQFQLGQIA